MATSDDLMLVRALLAAQGITPPEDDLQAIADAQPLLRARIAALYTVDCGDAEPALVLRAREGEGA